ncbi:MAG: SIMPL domain-containing protein [Candidatus Beckwithbacteria bacterium]
MMKKGLGIFFGLVAIIFIFAWITSPMTVTVIGTGEVNVSATYATLALTVTGTGRNVTEAIINVKTKVDNLRKLLISRGVGETDLLEAPLTTYPTAAVTAGATGFSASVNLSAKVYDETGVNDLVADLYNNGATLVAKPVMATENQKDLEQKALDAALKDAQDQAVKISRKHLKLVKKIVNITQASSGTTATATSREAGSNFFKIAKAVQVVYKMW